MWATTNSRRFKDLDCFVGFPGLNLFQIQGLSRVLKDRESPVHTISHVYIPSLDPSLCKEDIDNLSCCNLKCSSSPTGERSAVPELELE